MNDVRQFRRRADGGLPDKLESRRQIVFRILGLMTIALALNYIIWRYARSLNLNALWFAIPMIVAETYGIVEMFLFIFMVWKPAKRIPPPPPDSAGLDVFIATYNEPVELVALTVKAAGRIDWSEKTVYLLDDGNRREMMEMARENHCEYITRGQEWDNKPRHAKAGNINNALLMTTGEFVLILDADQIPSPDIAKKILGYFEDPEVAFVQTPQSFYNIPPGDPFGSDAPLFYGPIQQGKDGHNSAFFCGSNAILRRDALIQLGLTDYVDEMEKRFRTGLQKLKVQTRNFSAVNPSVAGELKRHFRDRIAEAQKMLDAGENLEKISDLVRKTVQDSEKIISSNDLDEIISILTEFSDSGDEDSSTSREYLQDSKDDLVGQLSGQGEAEDLGLDSGALEPFTMTNSGEAIPVHALATISVTEDMATAMRLHALGWKSVFHSEILAYGLAPEDLDSSLKQRLRWAQGTIQIFLRENPLRKKGLTFSQRVMYFATIYSYFSGFFNLILLVAPSIYLITTIAPVNAWTWSFLARLLPFLIMNKILFRYLSWGISVWRGEQYSLALFPLMIKATVTALFKKTIGFVVTPKGRVSELGANLRSIWPQLLVIGVTAVSIPFGAVNFFLAGSIPLLGFVVNAAWGIYNIVMLSAIVKAAFYKAPEDWTYSPPSAVSPGA